MRKAQLCTLTLLQWASLLAPHWGISIHRAPVRKAHHMLQIWAIWCQDLSLFPTQM